MSYPEVNISCVANVFMRQMHFLKKGDIEKGHIHPFDHVTILAKGSVKITLNGMESTFSAPEMIFIRKDEIHMLEALEDDTLAYCVHALRNGEKVEDIVDPSQMPAGKFKLGDHLDKANPVACSPTPKWEQTTV